MTPRHYGLAGWLANNGRPAAVAASQQMTGEPDGVDWQRQDGMGYGLATSRGELGRIDEHLHVALLGAPRWTDPELQRLQDGQGPLTAIAAAYLHHGRDLCARMVGDFGLCLFDEQRREGILAVDRFGRWPLFWQQQGSQLIFGNSAALVRAHPAVQSPISNQGIYHYLFSHMVPAPASIYTDIQKIPAAHCLRFDDKGVEIRCYWQPTFSEAPLTDVAAAEHELLDRLGEAVARDASDDSGAFLSGGLDSSTVSGLLAKARPGEADTYSIGFDAEGYDEIGYARIATAHFGNRPHEYYVTPEDVLDALPLIAQTYDEPFGNSSALPAYFCARMAAADGKQRLLAGDGGDELFAGNARYAKQEVFEHYGKVPGWLRHGVLEPLLAMIPAQTGLVAKAKSYVDQANTPLPDRLQTYNFLCRLDLHEMFTDDFLASVDTELPLQLERDIYHRPKEATALNRMLYLDWQHTLADNDLRKVSRMCHLAGIDVAYPMLDEAVVDLSCRIPSRMKLKGQQLRYFYKQAVRDFLPGEIIGKKKQGFGLPFGVWMAEHPGLQALANDNLMSLRQRGIFLPAFIDKAIKLHSEGHAAYYGELIWILVMLELWLASHEH